MGARDPRVDAYIEKAQPFARPILNYMRKAVHAGCPGVQETMKWSAPHFDYHGIMCAMQAFKAHCALRFWKGALLGLGAGGTDAMGHFGRITSIDDLPGEKQLVALVKKAAKLNEEGVKPPRAAKTPKPALEMPDYFARALEKKPKARTTFDSFSPSHRREYIEWITEAKQEQTRQRRIETALEWLARGKSRNWQYER